MAGPVLTAGNVMDVSAVAMNDPAKTKYTYAVMIPYLNMALRELQEFFELNNIPVTDQKSAVINVPAGTTEIGFSPDPPIADTPYLPDNLIEPKLLWERNEGIDPYIPMTRKDFLPETLAGVELSQFGIYVWQDQKIKVLAANQDNDIKMDYIRSLFVDVTDEEDELNILNSMSFLAYRTAGLMCEMISRDETGATKHNNNAGLGLDRVIGIGTKGRQAITIRHRPFRNAYKRRNNV